MIQEYIFEGEKFNVSKPDDCKMTVSRDGFTAKISIHAATNMYREDLDGWGSDLKTLSQALDSACRRILNKSARPSQKELCASMDEFYQTLEK